MADIRDVGGLLGRAGLALPVADSDRLTVNYPNMFRLMMDLRGMGEQNVLYARLTIQQKDLYSLRAAEIYRDKFGEADGSIPASFEIITLTGWAPHNNQQNLCVLDRLRTPLASAVGSHEITPDSSL